HSRQRAEQEQIARGRAGALEPKLSKLTIVVPEAARVDGLVVKRDGSEVEGGLFGTAINVDPGKHSVSAEAPGRRKYDTEVTVPATGARETVEIPALAVARSEPETPPSTKPESPVHELLPAEAEHGKGGGLRAASYVALGVGVVGVG